MTRSIKSLARAARGLVIVGLTVASTIGTAPVAAQAPLVFVHGFHSDQATWGSTPSAVAAGVAGFGGQVITGAANLPSLSSYESQASQLGQNLPSLFPGYPLGNLIAVGHSNGGIVVRELAQTQPIQGLITIATPHQGAPLATMANQNVLVPFLVGWVSDVASPLAEYIGMLWNDNGCAILCWGLYQRITQIANMVEIGLNNVGFATQFTVLGEMDLYSSYQQSLNSGGRLASEVTTIPHRISIVSESDPNNMSIYTGLAPGSASTLSGTTRFMGLIYDGLYEYYSTYTDYDDPSMWTARQDAWKWGIGAYQLFSIDYYWCNLMGGTWNGLCHGDGIVPTWTAHWPGENVSYTLPFGPAHSQETQSPLVQTQLVVALQSGGFTFTP